MLVSKRRIGRVRKQLVPSTKMILLSLSKRVFVETRVMVGGERYNSMPTLVFLAS